MGEFTVLIANLIILYLIYNLFNEERRNVLFNDALDMFDLYLYDIRHMVSDHTV